MEKRDLYDKNRNLTGNTIYKDEEIPDNNYIVVVLAFFQNSEGKFLMQKRSQRKNGKWASTGGHPKSGETSIQGIITEIYEEIGLSVKPQELDLIHSGRQDVEHVFFDIYYVKKDFDETNLVLQKEEVESVKWFSYNEVMQLINNNLFFENHAEEFIRMIDIFRQRGINLEEL